MYLTGVERVVSQVRVLGEMLRGVELNEGDADRLSQLMDQAIFDLAHCDTKEAVSNLLDLPGDPVTGAANHVAPPVVIDSSSGPVVGRVSFGAAYEGPPGYVHGGIIASSIDGVAAQAEELQGRIRLTRSMFIRYIAPVPLNCQLLFIVKCVARVSRSCTMEVIVSSAAAPNVKLVESRVEFVTP